MAPTDALAVSCVRFRQARDIPASPVVIRASPGASRLTSEHVRRPRYAAMGAHCRVSPARVASIPVLANRSSQGRPGPFRPQPPLELRCRLRA